MPPCTFRVDAAGVEGDALAHHHVRLGLAAAVPLEHDELRPVGRAAAHGEQRTHAEGLHVGLLQHLHRHALVGGGDAAGGLGEVGRVADVRRQVAELAGQLDAGGDGHAALQRGGILARDGERGQLAAIGFGLAGGGVAVGGMVGGHYRLLDGEAGITAGHLEFRQRDEGAHGRAGAQGAHGLGHGLAVGRRTELAGIAQAHHQHARRGHAGQVVQHGDVAGLARQVAAGLERREPPAGGLVDRGRTRRQAAVGEHAHHEGIGGDGAGRGGVQVEFECHRRVSVECGAL
ncbi:MAG: hypothetical protein KatS3mg127_1431 [Silanimonas sp.]|nr:MAG: hypothetical protein KatS3mg127_1431 [Silanimonas sp.]